MLEGSRGLLFTDETPDVVTEWFESFKKRDFARTGNKATETFELPAGPILINDEPAPHSLEPQFRKLGLSTSLLKGVPTLNAPHTVCSEGDTLNPNQVNLLKLFGKTFATVRRPSSSERPASLLPVCVSHASGLIHLPCRWAPQFQIVPLLGISLADGAICGGTVEGEMADEE